MVDPLQRRDFDKPKPQLALFLSTLKEIRTDLNEFLRTLFFTNDLEKRKQAFLEIRNLKKKYSKQIELLPMEKRKEIIQALTIDMKKLEYALRSVPISIFMDIDGVKMPIVSRMTNKPFTLFDFFDDVQMLTHREVTFQFHTQRIDGQLGVFFPGLNDTHFFTLMDTKVRLHASFQYSFGNVDYSFTPSTPGAYNIRGKAELRHLPSHVQYEIPHGIMPSDLNQAIDSLIKGG